MNEKTLVPILILSGVTWLGSVLGFALGDTRREMSNRQEARWFLAMLFLGWTLVPGIIYIGRPIIHFVQRLLQEAELGTLIRTKQVEQGEDAMKPHNWEVEEVDGGPIGIGEFWICHACGASAGPVAWFVSSKSKRWSDFLAGVSLAISNDDCDAAKQTIEKYRATHGK